MLCDNFYKSLAGGRLYFDNELKDKYREDLET